MFDSSQNIFSDQTGKISLLYLLLRGKNLFFSKFSKTYFAFSGGIITLLTEWCQLAGRLINKANINTTAKTTDFDLNKYLKLLNTVGEYDLFFSERNR